MRLFDQIVDLRFNSRQKVQGGSLGLGQLGFELFGKLLALGKNLMRFDGLHKYFIGNGIESQSQFFETIRKLPGQPFGGNKFPPGAIQPGNSLFSF